MEHPYYQATSVIYQIIAAFIRASAPPEEFAAEAPAQRSWKECVLRLQTVLDGAAVRVRTYDLLIANQGQWLDFGPLLTGNVR
jgi:hypothetical protein